MGVVSEVQCGCGFRSDLLVSGRASSEGWSTIWCGSDWSKTFPHCPPSGDPATREEYNGWGTPSVVIMK